MKIEEAAKTIQEFEDGDLTDRLFNLEVNFRGVNKTSSRLLCEQEKVTPDLLKAAFHIKKEDNETGSDTNGTVMFFFGERTHLPFVRLYF